MAWWQRTAGTGVAIGAASILLMAVAAHSQDVCGSPPSFDVKKEEADAIKGDLTGKAEGLAKFLGEAELGGKIEKERKSIYQTSPESEANRKDEYLAYVFCTIIMQDKTANMREKLDALQTFRKPISQLATPSNAEGAHFDLSLVSFDAADKRLIILATNNGGTTAMTASTTGSVAALSATKMTKDEEDKWMPSAIENVTPLIFGTEFYKGVSRQTEAPLTELQINGVLREHAFLYVFIAMAFSDSTMSGGQYKLATACMYFHERMDRGSVCLGHNGTFPP
jgi:hypothetical protein